MWNLRNLISAGQVCVCLVALSVGSGPGCEKRAPGPGGATPAPSAPPAGGGAGGSGASGLSAGGGLTRSTKYEVAPASADQLGTLEVIAVYTTDKIPEQAEVPVNINVEYCNHKVFTEDVIVDKATRGLKNVVVRLEGITRGPKAPAEKTIVLNRGCTFVPHVSVATKGTLLEIRNEDPVFHTTHPYHGGRHWFNIPLQKKGDQGDASRPRPFNLPGVVEFNCDVHKWMKGYAVVHTSPYIAVSDDKGKISMDQIPLGEHPYVAWHERLGEQRGTIKVEAGKSATLKLEFKLPQ